MNDNEENGEVHPLDQDYSETDVRQPTQFRLPDGRLLRAGSIIFVSGLFLVIVSSVWLGVFRSSWEIEIGAGYVHRVAMLMILGGGVLFLIACRKRIHWLNRTRIRWDRKAPVILPILTFNAFNNFTGGN